ncbi:hypothetical protein [Emticicia sp. W12TSBA100-4]|uniref:hypothetical protein n=1 Tax=Emticicia sp. W12TSBA100-4 TaxID=3160965 RepID=UPI0033063F3D
MQNRLTQIHVPQYAHLTFKIVPMWVCKYPKSRNVYDLSCGELLMKDLVEIVDKFNESRTKLFMLRKCQT